MTSTRSCSSVMPSPVSSSRAAISIDSRSALSDGWRRRSAIDVVDGAAQHRRARPRTAGASRVGSRSVNPSDQKLSPMCWLMIDPRLVDLRRERPEVGAEQRAQRRRCA